MRIAVNTRFLLHNRLEGIGTFTHEVLRRIVPAHPEHTFIFLFDRPWHPSFIYAPNVEPLQVAPPARHPLLYLAWFEGRLPQVFRQSGAHLFFSPDGYLSLRSGIPQVPVFHDLAFEHHPGDVSWLTARHYRNFFPRYAAKAAQVLTVSEYSKRDIMDKYKLGGDKITVVFNGANDRYKPLEKNDIALVRATRAQGLPYYLYVGALHHRKNIVRLLRAYAKYYQHMISTGQTANKLLIVGRMAWGTAEMKRTYSAPGFPREMVLFTGRLADDDLARVMASAHYHINVSYLEGFGIPVLESLKCGVPAIVAGGSALHEVGGKAALVVNPYSVDDIAKALVRTTVDSELRERLQGVCLDAAGRFSWDLTAQGVWQALVTVAAQHGITQ